MLKKHVTESQFQIFQVAAARAEFLRAQEEVGLHVAIFVLLDPYDFSKTDLYIDYGPARCNGCREHDG